ncbi:MAG: hypothetical protein KKF41_15980 [Actinobacteria bacterium]|nr:hypothetical protein [Actinomycetota bacterium]MBU1944525.1 hypothetical protein [Actinomycetota bacterium]MBU2689078.1 hypothetical protein [Actinomycetota bacterium]
MRKRMVPAMVVLLLLLLGVTWVLAGCGSTTSNKTISDAAEKQIAAANAALEDAKAKGVQVSEDDTKLITTAQGELDSAPVQALIDATIATARIEDDVKDAFAVAQGTYNTALGAAKTVIAAAPAGTDLVQANQSVANAEAKATAAKTIPDWYNATDGPIYWANLAAQQAASAANARAVALGQQQGVAQEAKAMSGYIGQVISGIDTWLKGKNYDPSTFTVGVTKVSQDGSTITAVAAPSQPMPGQPQVFTFIFTYKNGQFVITSSPQ